MNRSIAINELFDPRVGHYDVYDEQSVAQAVDLIRRGKIVAAHFHKALDSKLCAEASEKIAVYADKNYYDGAPGVGRIGDSLFEAANSIEKRVDYVRNAATNLKISRSMFPAGGYPLDQLRIWLDDAWHRPVSRHRTEDGLCNIGLLRFLEPGGEIAPHNDCAAADAPYSLVTQQVDIQIAWNCYLSMPDNGGAIYIYPQRFSRQEYDSNRLPAPNQYGLRDECLPRDPVVILPKRGDIIMFDATFPHRVSRIEGSRPRYTLSCFIAVNRDGTLALFS